MITSEEQIAEKKESNQNTIPKKDRPIRHLASRNANRNVKNLRR